MKNVRFTKMQSNGDDYICFDCFEHVNTFNLGNLFTTETLEKAFEKSWHNAGPQRLVIKSPETLALKLTNRHKSIGGNGIVLMLPSDKADAKMRVFNAFGSEVNMCANAISCVAKYLYDSKKVRNKNIKIETLSGIIDITLISETSAEVNMGPARLKPEEIPVLVNGGSVIAHPVNIGGANYKITCVSMGDPYAVVFCDEFSSGDSQSPLENFPLHKIGPLFEHNELFPHKVSTGFVQVIGTNRLKLRVWERGIGETMACGTGACAAAVAAVVNGYCDKNTDITVQLAEGELIIKYTGETVYMTGDCHKVFEGTVEI